MSGEKFFLEETMRTLIDLTEFAEGPAETPDGTIYYCEKDAHTINRITLDGEIISKIDTPGGCNGLAIDGNGNFFICANESKQIIKRTPDGTVTVLVDSTGSTPLVFPNDIWLSPHGGFYFTDTNFNGEGGEGDAVYYMAPDMKTVRMVNHDMANPNGVVGSPDGSVLYVSNFYFGEQGETYAFDIQPDGSLTNKRLFAQAGEDGATVDNEGNVYLTGKTLTVWSQDGVKLDEIALPEPELLTNCTFVGADKNTLLVTGWTGVYSVRTTKTGL